MLIHNRRVLTSLCIHIHNFMCRYYYYPQHEDKETEVPEIAY